MLLYVFIKVGVGDTRTNEYDLFPGKVSLQVIKIENNFIRIIIADNGEGVSKEQANNLFKPYFTTKSSGTGLGLAMCKDIIEKFNGKISFESVENVGTKFLIDLPIYTV